MDHRPPPIMVSEPGSFAEYTVARRLPRIVRDVVTANEYPPEIVEALSLLEAELPDRRVTPLREAAPDAADWRQAWAPWAGAAWRELPWFLAEILFYWRILEEVRYFSNGPWNGRDPFATQKRAALSEGLSELATSVASLSGVAAREERFGLWLHRALWGNRADLSNAAVNAQVWRAEASAGVIVDHTAEVWRLLAGGDRGGVRRVDLIADNAGPELLVDLGLLAFLLSEGLTERAYLQLKPHPFFVSDATIPDLEATVAAMQGSSQEALRHTGEALRRALAGGRLVVRTHPFYTAPLHYSQLPHDLAEDLARSDLLILKGDLNYRRLLEDRHWPPDTDLAAVTSFMPAPFVVLRTLKSEVVAGLPPGRAEELALEDPDWLIDGKRGVIQFARPS